MTPRTATRWPGLQCRGNKQAWVVYPDRPTGGRGGGRPVQWPLVSFAHGDASRGRWCRPDAAQCVPLVVLYTQFTKRRLNGSTVVRLVARLHLVEQHRLDAAADLLDRGRGVCLCRAPVLR
jgi:hypothetical protein